MQKNRQISESLQLGILLALAGGFMDAYSYVCRGHVFANAQTGNILLMGVNFSKGNWPEALRYLCPVLAFVAGIAIADIAKINLKEKNLLHWRQITILLEAIVLFFVSFLSQDVNLLANSLTSFACGIQVETFRKINGHGIATTMCIGNLRTATQSILDYHYTRNKAEAQKGILFYGIILFFVFGAILGNFCVEMLQEKAIIICVLFLLAGFLFMFIDVEKQDTLFL